LRDKEELVCQQYLKELLLVVQAEISTSLQPLVEVPQQKETGQEMLSASWLQQAAYKHQSLMQTL